MSFSARIFNKFHVLDMVLPMLLGYEQLLMRNCSTCLTLGLPNLPYYYHSILSLILELGTNSRQLGVMLCCRLSRKPNSHFNDDFTFGSPFLRFTILRDGIDHIKNKSNNHLVCIKCPKCLLCSNNYGCYSWKKHIQLWQLFAHFCLNCKRRSDWPIL